MKKSEERLKGLAFKVALREGRGGKGGLDCKVTNNVSKIRVFYQNS